MQNVACPRTMVQKLNGMSSRLNAERSAMPVMMTGSAIGRVTSSDTTSRPKNFAPDTAAAQSVPRISATSVEYAASCSDSVSAGQMSARLNATTNQLSVSPGGGQAKLFSSVVKA